MHVPLVQASSDSFLPWICIMHDVLCQAADVYADTAQQIVCKLILPLCV